MGWCCHIGHHALGAPYVPPHVPPRVPPCIHPCLPDAVISVTPGWKHACGLGRVVRHANARGSRPSRAAAPHPATLPRRPAGDSVCRGPHRGASQYWCGGGACGRPAQSRLLGACRHGQTHIGVGAGWVVQLAVDPGCAPQGALRQPALGQLATPVVRLDQLDLPVSPLRRGWRCRVSDPWQPRLALSWTEFGGLEWPSPKHTPSVRRGGSLGFRVRAERTFAPNWQSVGSSYLWMPYTLNPKAQTPQCCRPITAKPRCQTS